MVRHDPTASSWDAAHTNSNSFLNSYNPLLQSGLSLSFSQPLLRDFSTDRSRGRSSRLSRTNRDIADTRLQRERRPHHRRGEDGLLEPGLGARQRRGAAVGPARSPRNWCA